MAINFSSGKAQDVYLWWRDKIVTLQLSVGCLPIEIAFLLGTAQDVYNNPGLCMPIIRQHRAWLWNRNELSLCTQVSLQDLRELDEGKFLFLFGKWNIKKLVRYMRIPYN